LLVLCSNYQKMKIIVRKDGEWYIAEVQWKENVYAFWYTEEEAVKELNNVVDMMLDYYNKEVSVQESIKNLLKNKKYSYAV
jgi:hypothetical protein